MVLLVLTRGILYTLDEKEGGGETCFGFTYDYTLRLYRHITHKSNNFFNNIFLFFRLVKSSLNLLLLIKQCDPPFPEQSLLILNIERPLMYLEKLVKPTLQDGMGSAPEFSSNLVTFPNCNPNLDFTKDSVLHSSYLHLISFTPNSPFFHPPNPEIFSGSAKKNSIKLVSATQSYIVRSLVCSVLLVAFFYIPSPYSQSNKQGQDRFRAAPFFCIWQWREGEPTPNPSFSINIQTYTEKVL